MSPSDPKKPPRKRTPLTPLTKKPEGAPERLWQVYRSLVEEDGEEGLYANALRNQLLSSGRTVAEQFFHGRLAKKTEPDDA